ncbi:unnamed protein product [Ranitomeya imitator]|uniref:Cytochrome b-c1 complex subunit 8 n=1 Tax=Ranitomeya imitator TaxID=111125 RepID=A0ABN9MEL3_9NEOB|nr:unnamed protein product [Ranitomeya imitator]
MGLHFGDLAKVRHVITFTLSPFEQRAFANFLSKGIPNTWRRISSNFLTIVPRLTALLLFHNPTHLRRADVIGRQRCALHSSCTGCEHRSAGKQSGDVTALLSGRCAHSQYRRSVEHSAGGQTAVAFALAYLVYNWGTHEHQRLKRKDPSLYENDQ